MLLRLILPEHTKIQRKGSSRKDRGWVLTNEKGRSGTLNLHSSSIKAPRKNKSMDCRLSLRERALFRGAKGDNCFRAIYAGTDGTTDNTDRRNGKTERTTNEPNDSNGSFDQSVFYSSHSPYSWSCSWLRPKAALGLLDVHHCEPTRSAVSICAG